MSDATGLTRLEQQIERFESKIEEMAEVTREANSLLKQLRVERKEIERLLSKDVKKMVQERTDEVVKVELDEIGPKIREQTKLIYERVGEQIDKLIDLCLGKEFATNHKREDLRPDLAKKLRIWIQEIFDEEEDKRRRINGD